MINTADAARGWFGLSTGAVLGWLVYGGVVTVAATRSVAGRGGSGMRRAVESSVIAAAAVVFGSSLSACTSTPTPAPTTPATPVSVTSSTTSGTPPATSTSVPPTSTRALTPLQTEAIAAVEAYYDAVEAATTARSSGAMRRLFAASCTPCESLADRIDDLKKSNQSVEGGVVIVSGLTAMEGTDAGIGVQGTMRATSAKLRDSQGKVIHMFDESVKSPVVWLFRRDGARLVLVDIRA